MPDSNVSAVTPLDRIGLALDRCDRDGVEIVCDAAFRIRISVADLRAVFSTASLMVSDLRDLNLPDPAQGALWRGGIGTIAQLLTRTRDDLLDIRGLGLNRLNEIETALALKGLTLAEEPAAPAVGKSTESIKKGTRA